MRDIFIDSIRPIYKPRQYVITSQTITVTDKIYHLWPVMHAHIWK